MEYISALEDALNIKAAKVYLPLQPGDVPSTFADTSKLQELIDFVPQTSVRVGISKFVTWYRQYFGYSPISS